jgi:hypothetical protein
MTTHHVNTTYARLRRLACAATVLLITGGLACSPAYTKTEGHDRTKPNIYRTNGYLVSLACVTYRALNQASDL